MPYITDEQKDILRKRTVEDPALFLINEGDLGYALGVCINSFMEANKPIRYSVFARVTGVVVTVLFDFLLRFLAPYENRKMLDNGDVYTFHGEEK